MEKRFCVLLCVTFLMSLSACAEKWEKPGATQQEFDAMKAACGSRAYARFPPMLRPVQISNGYTTPITTNCNGFGYSVNCYTTGGQYVPPVVINVDDNDSAREQDIRTCFYQNGWQPAKERAEQAQTSNTDAAPKAAAPIVNKSKMNKKCLNKCLKRSDVSKDTCESICSAE